MKKLNNIKKYNIFIFFTTFARVLVETFIPIILHNQGYSLNSILIFLMVSFLIIIILTPIVSFIGRKIGFKWLIFLSAFLFVLMYYLLLSKPNLYLLAFLYSTNISLFYLSKHNYTAAIIDNKKMGSKIGGFMIAGMIAGIPAGYIGAVFLNRLSVPIIISLVLIIYLIGVIPIKTVKISTHTHPKVFKTLIKIPKKNLLFFALTQFKIILFFLYPLYVFIFVRSQYRYIGLLSVIVGIASMLFVYFNGRLMDKKKSDFMLIAALFLSLIMFIQVRFATATLLLFTAFFEGLSTKMYEMSISRDLYFFDKKLDQTCYFIVFEVLNNIVKLLIVFMLFIFKLDLTASLYILIIGVFISGFIKYQNPKIKSS